MKQDLIRIHELQVFLPDHPSIHTVYAWCSRKLIPFHKYGKTTFFSKSEIIEWNDNGRPATTQEVSR